jgi:geranylgeranyl pyrophosphate synthase
VATWNDTTRPGVLALAYEAVGGKAEEVVPLQTAMLFIDAAMDIHDDIIDKSIIKGSKETLYGKFGEETALTNRECPPSQRFQPPLQLIRKTAT